MIEPVLANPRVLVVEDDSVIRNDLVRCLRRISPSLKHKYGISDFEIEEAGYVAKAQKSLTEAKTPYDLVLLDLHLPKNGPDDSPALVEHGAEFLNFIQESQTAKGVIIVSIWNEYQNVVNSFRGGALDFVKKEGLFHDDLQTSVLNALARLMVKDSERALNQRVHDLVAYAEIGLANSFRLIFSTLLRGVTEATDGIEKQLGERVGLDREKEPNDSLLLKLYAHEKAVAQAREDWAGLQAGLVRGGTSLDRGYIRDMLHDLKKSLLPCLVVKRVSFDPPELADKPVLTFEKDVEVVLREIIVGILNELPDYGEAREIRISFTTEDTRAKVRFEDDLERIPEEQMEAINQGQRIIPDAKFGRVWGLSVAQHVALRGGGELKVETERGGNVVTYYVPLADHV